MNDLERYIGLLLQYRPPGVVGLSVYELSALIEFAGRFAGFAVKPERIVPLTLFGCARRPEIDCVWTALGNADDIVVAWEIDCINVKDNHLSGATIQPVADLHKAAVGNIRKFRGASARLSIQALYSYRAGHNIIDRSVEVTAFCQSQLPTLSVLTDVELLQGQLQHVIDDAQAL